MFDWRFTVAWLGLASVGGVSAAGLTDEPRAATQIAVAAPAPAPVAAPLEADKPIIQARRERDGLFYATLAINGEPVRFLIDTGSDRMVLRGSDADRAGVRETALPATLSTADGVRQARWARLNGLRIGPIAVGPVDAVVTGDEPVASLLGQDVLGRLGQLTIRGDLLTVTSTSS